MAGGRGVVAVAVAAVGIAGVTVALTGGPGAEHSMGRPTVALSSEGAGPDAPASPTGFTAGPGEVRGEVKEAAARFVEGVGTWRRGAAPDPTARVVAAGYPADLAEVARPLFDVPAWESTTTVLYPQYGGLTPSTASVIVLARQEWRGASADGVREVLLDVRLRSAGGIWNVTAVLDPPRPPGPPTRTGGPTRAGRALLEAPRLALPDPVRADITAGRLGDPMIAVMLDLARSFDIQVQVAVSGHPGTVFPTRRLSNHAVGRAMDVRAINGVPVVDIPRDDPVLTSFMTAAARAGATEVGGPIPVAGRGLFTDSVHQDHVHVGFTPTKAPAAVNPS